MKNIKIHQRLDNFKVSLPPSEAVKRPANILEEDSLSVSTNTDRDIKIHIDSQNLGMKNTQGVGANNMYNSSLYGMNSIAREKNIPQFFVEDEENRFFGKNSFDIFSMFDMPEILYKNNYDIKSIENKIYLAVARRNLEFVFQEYNTITQELENEIVIDDKLSQTFPFQIDSPPSLSSNLDIYLKMYNTRIKNIKININPQIVYDDENKDIYVLYYKYYSDRLNLEIKLLRDGEFVHINSIPCKFMINPNKELTLSDALFDQSKYIAGNSFSGMLNNKMKASFKDGRFTVILSCSYLFGLYSLQQEPPMINNYGYMYSISSFDRMSTFISGDNGSGTLNFGGTIYNSTRFANRNFQKVFDSGENLFSYLSLGSSDSAIKNLNKENVVNQYELSELDCSYDLYYDDTLESFVLCIGFRNAILFLKSQSYNSNSWELFFYKVLPVKDDSFNMIKMQPNSLNPLIEAPQLVLPYIDFTNKPSDEFLSEFICSNIKVVQHKNGMKYLMLSYKAFGLLEDSEDNHITWKSFSYMVPFEFYSKRYVKSFDEIYRVVSRNFEGVNHPISPEYYFSHGRFLDNIFGDSSTQVSIIESGVNEGKQKFMNTKLSQFEFGGSFVYQDSIYSVINSNSIRNTFEDEGENRIVYRKGFLAVLNQWTEFSEQYPFLMNSREVVTPVGRQNFFSSPKVGPFSSRITDTTPAYAQDEEYGYQPERIGWTNVVASDTRNEIFITRHLDYADNSTSYKEYQLSSDFVNNPEPLSNFVYGDINSEPSNSFYSGYFAAKDKIVLGLGLIDDEGFGTDYMWDELEFCFFSRKINYSDSQDNLHNYAVAYFLKIETVSPSDIIIKYQIRHLKNGFIGTDDIVNQTEYVEVARVSSMLFGRCKLEFNVSYIFEDLDGEDIFSECRSNVCLLSSEESKQTTKHTVADLYLKLEKTEGNTPNFIEAYRRAFGIFYSSQEGLITTGKDLEEVKFCVSFDCVACRNSTTAGTFHSMIDYIYTGSYYTVENLGDDRSLSKNEGLSVKDLYKNDSAYLIGRMTKGNKIVLPNLESQNEFDFINFKGFTEGKKTIEINTFEKSLEKLKSLFSRSVSDIYRKSNSIVNFDNRNGEEYDFSITFEDAEDIENLIILDNRYPIFFIRLYDKYTDRYFEILFNGTRIQPPQTTSISIPDTFLFEENILNSLHHLDPKDFYFLFDSNLFFPTKYRANIKTKIIENNFIVLSEPATNYGFNYRVLTLDNYGYSFLPSNYLINIEELKDLIYSGNIGTMPSRNNFAVGKIEIKMINGLDSITPAYVSKIIPTKKSKASDFISNYSENIYSVRKETNINGKIFNKVLDKKTEFELEYWDASNRLNLRRNYMTKYLKESLESPSQFIVKDKTKNISELNEGIFSRLPDGQNFFINVLHPELNEIYDYYGKIRMVEPELSRTEKINHDEEEGNFTVKYRES